MALAIALAVVGIINRSSGDAGADTAGSVAGSGGSSTAETAPLALPPVDAPDASSASCTSLLTALPAELDTNGTALRRRQVAAPAPAGAVAWAAIQGPVVLRCGLPKPPELVPTSALLDINGVSWLPVSDAETDTFIAVDRPVYVVLSVPRGLGTGAVQVVSDTVRQVLAARAPQVR